jgi:hypothetical protein
MQRTKVTKPTFPSVMGEMVLERLISTEIGEERGANKDAGRREIQGKTHELGGG